MAEYRVVWEIDIEAESPLGAARTARSYQLDPLSAATVFRVTDEHGLSEDIDLTPEWSN